MSDDGTQTPEGMPPAVHAYLSQAFGRLSGQIEGARTASEHAANTARETAERVTVIEWHVFGSKPPPRPVDARPLVGRLSETELDSDKLAEEALSQAGRLDRLEHEVASARSELRRQSVESLGLARATATPSERRAAFLGSRAGRTFLLAVATLFLTSVTTIATAIIAARAPSAVAAGKAP